MPRGGYRKGAGRKKEYKEPVIKVLIGLPKSKLQQLDDFAERHNLSRPKAIIALLDHLKGQSTVLEAKTRISKESELIDELKALKKQLKSTTHS